MIKKNTYSFYHKRIRTALCAVLCSVLTAMPAFATGEDNSPTAAASTTVWTKASEIMQDVYSQIISISTVTAVVCAAVALLLMNFSKNGKTVDDSRAWLKRIAITWAILNGLGFIMAYVTPFFQGGTWNPQPLPCSQKEVTAFGHFRRHCRLASNAGDEPAGSGICLGTRRVGLQYGHVQAVLPYCFGYV